MDSVSFLVKADRVCDYVPLLSSVSNLVDLFQKCVVLPLMDKETIESNHYFKHLDQKSFLRCLVLVIPVFGNLGVGIYDFSRSENADISDDKAKVTPISKVEIPKRPHISLDNVEKIEIGAFCAQSFPCQHQIKVTLNDGSSATQLNSFDIWSIVSEIPEEKINPNNKDYPATSIKAHFRQYSEFIPVLERGPRPVDEVLNQTIFL